MSEGLSARDAALVGVSAALAVRRDHRLREALEAALAAGADPAAVEEVILQAYLFLGYPSSLGAFAAWREVSGEPSRVPTAGSLDDWRERGERVCRQVYAGQYANLRANIGDLHADLAEWMVVEGYGKVLGRPGLELGFVQLCIAALLAVLDTPVQLHSHLRGSLNVGASVADVAHALEIALAYADEAAARRARETWGTVRSRWRAPAGAAPE